MHRSVHVMRSRLVFALLSTLCSVLLPVCATAEGTVEIVPQVTSISSVSTVALSPDGTLAVSGDFQGAVTLWSVASRRILRQFGGHAGSVNSVAFSPDGNGVLTAGGDGLIKLWQARSGRLIRTFSGHKGYVNAIAYAPDGSRIASAGADGQVMIWSLASGTPIARASDGTDVVKSVAFSPDGRRVVSGGVGGKLLLWDSSSGALVGRLAEGLGSIKSVTFSLDGKHALSGTDDGKIRLWEVATGALVRSFSGHTSWVNAVAYSPDGRRIASAGRDGSIKLWDVATGKALMAIAQKEHWIVETVAFSRDGKGILANGNLAPMQAFDVATGSLIAEFKARTGAHRAKLAVAPDALRLMTAGSSTFTWDLEAGRVAIDWGRYGATAAAFSVDGRTLYTSNNTSLRTWDAASGQPIMEFKPPSLGTDAHAYSTDGLRFMAGGPDNVVQLWNSRNGELIRTFKGHTEQVQSIAVTADGTRLVSGADDGTVAVWNAATGERLLSLEGGRRAGAIEAIEQTTGHVVETFRMPAFGVSAVAVSRDGSRVVSGAVTGVVKLWDGHTGKLIREVQGPIGAVSCIAFTPDEAAILACGNDRMMRLLDADLGSTVKSFSGHMASVEGAAFSPDGKRLFSTGSDGTVRIWDVATGGLLVTMLTDGEVTRLGDPTWVLLTSEGFFNASSAQALPLLDIVRGFDAYNLGQMWQSLYAPDLVREKLAGDPNREVSNAAAVLNLDKVIDSGKAPAVSVAASPPDTKGLTTVKATITEQERDGIGRVEWRVDGLTVGVANPAPGSGGTLNMDKTIALLPGESTIEVVAYNGRNLMASRPARTKVTWTWAGGDVDFPRLHVLAIGIDKYVDRGGIAPGETEAKLFPPLQLAVHDANAIAREFMKAGRFRSRYHDVRVRTVLDEEATAAGLDAIVNEMTPDIKPGDTFVFYAATHGYSHRGRFYLIPQDHQGGPAPEALAAHAIDQLKIQDWITNRIKARKVLILLDSCESGALTAGHHRSRFDSSVTDAAIGRLHEATGRPVLTAAGLGQSALELTELGHGVFTSALIDAIYSGDTNGDDAISLSEIVKHVQKLVPRLIKDPEARADVLRRGPVGGVQSPRFGGRGEDFVLFSRLEKSPFEDGKDRSGSTSPGGR